MGSSSTSETTRYLDHEHVKQEHRMRKMPTTRERQEQHPVQPKRGSSDAEDAT